MPHFNRWIGLKLTACLFVLTLFQMIDPAKRQTQRECLLTTALLLPPVYYKQHHILPLELREIIHQNCPFSKKTCILHLFKSHETFKAT